eukprot:TRINITY_DN21553_c0_g1_i1.p1 TRINITY_DN21553_c0_g1~~TRINITY_DN21553_c0_g1_i1.p1  ORF type:complete len:231 (-),score=49.77 TRINITY_DN21553_c0_g1_i1:147-839(-)
MKSTQSIFILSLLIGSQAQPSPRSPGCDLCVQIVTAIDDFITDASTEQDIIDFVEGLCATLGWPLDSLCESMVESYIPEIIDGLVSGNLNPGDVCRSIGMCEADETTHLPDHTTTWWEGACTGGDDCCNGECGVGEGDCDDNDDCAGNLLCGDNNCIGLTFEGSDDCCYEGPHCHGADDCCDGQCGEGEGDCDWDSDCAGFLVCGSANCVGQGFDDSDDCCKKPWGHMIL